MFELYAITDRKMLGDVSEVEAARLCFEGGADVVQLRMKDTDGGEMLEKAKAIQEIAQQYCKFFIVNDRLDIAILAGADGVHLGQTDIPVQEARRLVGDEMIIGVSASTVEEAVKAVDDGADYIGVGSIFNTSTKPDADQGIGLDTLMDICQAVDVPVVAIGGINKGNIRDVIRAGADGAAVVSAIMAKPDIKAAAHELKVMVLNEKRDLNR
ncbi:thiamine monophosphate synthase ThiE2 [methanogenic archaeon ISO4-H5]|nr:thiamine monophosphate synthase ThiE2 [methanogenic archaeon ISO4-H5]